MPKKRIAISGKMTSGKTTCSEHLIERFGYKRISFATPIKWIVEKWFRNLCESRHSSKEVDHVAEVNRLYFFLCEVFDGDLPKASRATDMLTEEILPDFYDIDWSVEKNAKWRKCLQDVGGGRIRTELDDNVWINHAVRQMKPDGLYICDDLRYRNEYGLLETNGFTTIRLDISKEMQQERIKKLYGNIDPIRLLHPSEIDLDDTKFQHHLDADQQLTWVLHDLISIVECEE